MSKDDKKKKTITDAGEHLPYAKKHLATKKNFAATSVVLDDLFPEPNWLSMAADGYPIEVVAYLTAVYYGLRKKPRNYYFGGVDEQQWQLGYIAAINAVKELFTKTKTPEDVEQFSDRFNTMLGFPEPAGIPVDEKYVLYAAGGGGTRTIGHTLGFSNKQICLEKWLPKLDWPHNEQAIKTKYFPVKFANGQWGLCKPVAKGYQYDRGSMFDTFDEVFEAFDNQNLKKEPTYRPKKKAFDLAQTNISNNDVTGDELIKTFGLRAVQYGRSLSNPERQLWLNNVFYALEVFGELINMPSKKWVGLGGLAIAFGARGSGTASAHFEPGLFAINMSRRTGPGSLAHELFHGLDHRLTKRISSKDWYNCHNYITPVIHSYDMSEFCNQIPDVPEHYKILRSFFDCRRRVQTDSQFVKQARRLTRQHGGNWYWSSVEEIYARSFEAYIQDKLINMDIQCPWLSHGTLEADFPQNKIKMHPYPIGSERIALYEKWEQFFKALYLKDG